MSAAGTLRLDRAAPPPWLYRGELVLPAGRTCSIEGRILEDTGGRFFELRCGLVPGMTSAELEAALTEIEAEQAEKIRRAGRALEDVPIDELPF